MRQLTLVLGHRRRQISGAKFAREISAATNYDVDVNNDRKILLEKKNGREDQIRLET